MIKDHRKHFKRVYLYTFTVFSPSWLDLNIHFDFQKGGLETDIAPLFFDLYFEALLRK